MTCSKKKPWTAGIVLLAILLLASCTEDETPGGNNDDRPATLALSVVKATDIDVRQVATRAVTTTDYPTSGSIGFFVKEDTANGYAACDNREGKYSTARKLWLPVDSIWLNSHDADIAIYAPYDAAHTTPATMNLTAALRPADGSKDIWCKHITASNTNKSPAVTLEHLYSRLYLTIKRDATYTADASLTALDVKGDEVYESATYKPFETAPYTYSSTTGLTPTVTAQTLNASTASATYDLLLIPTPLTGDITLTLTVDGKKMETIIDKTRFADSKLDAGKQYNVNLTLKPGKLEIASVSLVKWDALPEINGGQAEFDEIKGIDIGLDFVVAPGNLIATRYVGDGGGYMYEVADEQGYYSGDGSGGDYFNWNTLDPNLTDVIQTSWEENRDPCRQIDDGKWHTPTDVQLQALIDAGNVWTEGMYTMKDGTKVNGSYFGFGITTAPSVANQDKYVFLPAAGYRNENGYQYVNKIGDYWSVAPDPKDASNARGLSFRSSHCFVNVYKRNLAFSIRCVKDKPKPKPAHAIEVKGLDFYVADGNVVATKQADNTYKYSFAEEQGAYTGNIDGGDYFRYNTLEPTAGSSPMTFDDALDPCHQIGDSLWHTPTGDQLRAIANAGSIWGTWLKSDGTSVKGRYFGVTAVPDFSQRNSAVFLPATGYEQGSLIRNQTEAAYMSATNVALTDIEALWFDKNEVIINWNWKDLSQPDAYFGLFLFSRGPLRCVRDK